MVSQTPCFHVSALFLSPTFQVAAIPKAARLSELPQGKLDTAFGYHFDLDSLPESYDPVAVAESIRGRPRARRYASNDQPAHLGRVVRVPNGEALPAAPEEGGVPKLIYWDIRGLAQPIRLALAFAGKVGNAI